MMMKIDMIKPLSIAALFALGAPALAQDSGTAAPEDTVETQAPEAEMPAVDMGTEVTGEERKPGQPYVTEVVGDWEMKCLTNPNGDDPCQMYQLLKDEQGNSVAEVSLGKLPEGGQAVSGATIVVPLETLLTQQLTLAVDGGQTLRYPFRFCAQPGCVANIGFTGAEITSFKKGAKSTVTIVHAAAPAQKVNLTMSLKGFTAAYDKLVAPEAPDAPAQQ